MKKQLNNASRWLDARPQRERAMLLLAVLLALYFLWNAALMAPLAEKRSEIAVGTRLMSSKLVLMKAQTKALRASTSVVNNLEKNTNARRKALQNRIDVLDARLAHFNARLTSPKEMNSMMEKLLRVDPSIKLLAVKKLPSVVINAGSTQQGTKKVDGIRLYRHGLVLEFQATYPATLHYLKRLEGLGLPLSWRAIDYKVMAYPLAKVRLTVDTLSREQGWLGV